MMKHELKHLCILLFAIFVVAQVDEEAEMDVPGVTEPPLFEVKLVYGTILIFLCAVISSGAGLGGGGLFIPVFVLALQYNTKTAVPMSKSTILGVAYGGYAVNYSRRHPLVDRPLIDYDIALLLQPMILMGTILGVTLNTILPDFIISLLLVVLLVTVSYRSMRKGLRQYKEETAAMEAEKTLEVDPPDLQEKLLITPNGNGDKVGESSESDPESGPSDTDDTQKKKPKPIKASLGVVPGSMKRRQQRLSEANFDRYSYSQGGGRLSILANSKKYTHSIDFEQYEDADSGGETDVDEEEMLPVMETTGGEPSKNEGTYASPRMNSFDVQTRELPRKSQIQVGGGAIENQGNAVKMMLREEAATPWGKFLALLAILIGLILLTIFKGGAGTGSVIGVVCGTAAYWVLVLIAVPYLGSFTYFFARKRLQDSTRKEEIDYPYVEGDIRWNTRSVIVYPMFAILAGTAAGCLGIGGGLVLGPLLLDIGVFPPVVTATSAFTIIFTATSVVSQFIVLGKLPFAHGAWYCVLGFIAAVIGHNFVKSLVKKYKKNSIVSLVLGGAVGLSGIVLIVTKILDLTSGNIDFSFSSLCDPNAGE